MLTKTAPHALYEARERLGLSRQDLERITAERGFKVSQASIFNIEKGLTLSPYRRTIYALADALDLDASTLFETEVAS